jgi:hypothetical protein
MSAEPKLVELLYFDGCPGIERVSPRVAPLAEVAGARVTRHRVLTEDGRAYWAMCAIDALGMPYLLHEAAEVRAQQPGSDRTIRIAIDPATETVHAHPADAAVAVARAGDGCAAGRACPHINLFASTAAAERHLADSDLYGKILDLPAATAAGRRVFGDLLDRFGAGARR